MDRDWVGTCVTFSSCIIGPVFFRCLCRSNDGKEYLDVTVFILLKSSRLDKQFLVISFKAQFLTCSKEPSYQR